MFPPADSLKITPSFEDTPRSFRQRWAGVLNIDQFKWRSWSDVQEALELARREIGARTVRAVGMYGVGNRVFEREMAHRYGKVSMRDWLFELWNESNLEGGFWVGGQDLWMKLWQHTFTAIKRVDKDFRVGGPSTARGEWVGDLIDFGQAHDCLPDYIITHCYNNDSDADQALSPFDGPQSDRVSKSPNFASGVIRGVKTICERNGFTGEIHWNEWGRSWFPCDPERET